MHLLIATAPAVGLGKHLLFGAAGASSIHPVVAVAMLLGFVMMMALPRQHVVSPLLFLSILIPAGQMIMLGPLHLLVFRILIMFAWMRLICQRYFIEGQSSRIYLNALDKSVILYAVACIVCYTLLWQDSAALIDQLGKMFNVIGFYFVFRFFIRDRRDVERAIKVLIIIALIIAGCMFNEQLTGRNVLAIFGGVPEFTARRENYLRSQGPFEVFLTAGAFGATLLPLVLCLWHKKGARLMAALGIVAALTIIVTSRTSTAITASVATVIGLAMWPLRGRMRLVRWAIVLTLVALHLIMHAPVWSLIARIDLVGGSTGWHRYKIVDNFIRHFWDWCLLGSNNYWNWEGGDDMWDTANQYVFVGETSGLLSLIAFLAMIVYSFKLLGNARKAASTDRQQAWFLWLLGVAMFSHVVGFMGICYFDQTIISWNVFLAMIVAVTITPHQTVRSEPKRLPLDSRREPASLELVEPRSS